MNSIDNPFGPSKNTTFFTDTSHDHTLGNISKIMDQSKLLEINSNVSEEEEDLSSVEQDEEEDLLLELKMAGHTCNHEFLKESSFFKSIVS